MSRTLEYGPSLHYGGTHGIRKNDGAVGGNRPGGRERAVCHGRPGGRAGTPGDHRAGGDGPGRVIVNEGQDDAQDKGGKRVIVRKMQGGDGPGFDVFDMGGSRVGMVVRDVETADVTKEKLAGTAGASSSRWSRRARPRRPASRRRRRHLVRRRARPKRPSARAAGRGDPRRPHREGRAAAAGAPVTLDVTPEAPKMAHVMPGMPGEGGDVFS